MPSIRVFLQVLIASLIAGYAGAYLLSRVHPIFPLPAELAGLIQPTQEQIDEIRARLRWNDSAEFALIGALSLVAGWAACLPWTTKVSAITSFVGALVGGAVAGWMMAQIAFYCEDWLPWNWDKLIRLAVRWMIAIVPLGLLGGLLAANSWQWRNWSGILLGGLLGALCAGLGYSLVAGVLLQNENSDAVLPPAFIVRWLLFAITPFCIWIFVTYQFHILMARPAVEEPS